MEVRREEVPHPAAVVIILLDPFFTRFNRSKIQDFPTHPLLLLPLNTLAILDDRDLGLRPLPEPPRSITMPLERVDDETPVDDVAITWAPPWDPPTEITGTNASVPTKSAPAPTRVVANFIFSSVVAWREDVLYSRPSYVLPCHVLYGRRSSFWQLQGIGNFRSF